MISSVYSNYDWLPWKFTQTPKGYWDDINNIKSYINWLSEKLDIKTMEDWYKVTHEVNINTSINKLKIIYKLILK